VLYCDMVAARDQHATNAAYYARNRGRELKRVRVRQEATVAFFVTSAIPRAWTADCGSLLIRWTSTTETRISSHSD
ncbi:MAG: hypothetical protein M3O77_02020, partial [Chloroflexota bacterium]|nr:hypothetical protein [Chloroflexota bacterium]